MSSASAQRDLPPLELIFGSSSSMRAVREVLERASQTSIPLLIQGESGTGKEIVAKLAHAWSPFAQRALVKVNCPAIPHTLIESELFGSERGAFTGAYTTKRGRVEFADKGTLFLDEIGELDLAVQAKLLQLLQDGTFMRIGATVPRQVQIRLISATHKNLRDHTRGGEFRLDLFFRINAITLELPPLRERSGDIPALADYFVEQYCQRFNVARPRLSRQIEEFLQRYSWPGNIRQLENLIRAYVVVGSEELLLSELAGGTSSTAVEIDLALDTNSSLKAITRHARQRLESKIILKVLQANAWNRRKTAASLKISYRSLLYKLREIGESEFSLKVEPDAGVELPTPVPGLD